MKLTSLFAVLFAALVISPAAQAQSFVKAEVAGDVVTLSGRFDGWRDRNEIWRHINGKRVLILKDARGDSHDSAVMIGELVHKARLTTVLDGSCDTVCLPIFLAGKERLWGARAGTQPGVATLSYSNPTASGLPDLIQFYRQRTAMPARLSAQYLRTLAGRAELRMVQPSAENQAGQVLECAVGPNAPCQPRGELNLQNVGLLTTLDPYPLDAGTPPAMPAASPVPGAALTATATVTPVVTPVRGRVAQLTVGTTLFARAVDPVEGPTGIASTFPLEGRIFAYAPFSWSGGGASGAHEFETRWFRDEILVHQSPVQRVNWASTPGAAWYAVRAAEFGPGNYRVEFWMDGQRVAGKGFSIRAQ